MWSKAWNIISRAWSAFSSQKPKPDNRLESARLFLITRSFNSLRRALPTLEQGYYQQAMASVRMAMEDQLIAEDIEIHPPSLETLLTGKGRLPFPEMAGRISTEARKLWGQEYSFLSEYATHPQHKSLKELNVVGPDEQLTLRPGGHYDKVEVLTVLAYMIRELVNVMATIAKVSHSAGIEWDDETAPKFSSVLEKIESRWREINEWARNQIEEID